MESATEHEISFRCPHCERRCRVSREMAGRRGRCSRCKSAIRVPAAASRPAPARPRGPRLGEPVLTVARVGKPWIYGVELGLLLAVLALLPGFWDARLGHPYAAGVGAAVAALFFALIVALRGRRLLEVGTDGVRLDGKLVPWDEVVSLDRHGVRHELGEATHIEQRVRICTRSAELEVDESYVLRPDETVWKVFWPGFRETRNAEVVETIFARRDAARAQRGPRRRAPRDEALPFGQDIVVRPEGLLLHGRRELPFAAIEEYYLEDGQLLLRERGAGILRTLAGDHGFLLESLPRYEELLRILDERVPRGVLEAGAARRLALRDRAYLTVVTCLLPVLVGILICTWRAM